MGQLESYIMSTNVIVTGKLSKLPTLFKTQSGMEGILIPLYSPKHYKKSSEEQSELSFDEKFDSYNVMSFRQNIVNFFKNGVEKNFINKKDSFTLQGHLMAKTISESVEGKSYERTYYTIIADEIMR